MLPHGMRLSGKQKEAAVWERRKKVKKRKRNVVRSIKKRMGNIVQTAPRHNGGLIDRLCPTSNIKFSLIVF